MSEFAHRRQWGPSPRYDYVKGYSHPNNDFTIISGPCSLELEYQINEIAKYVSEAGATHLRAGVFRAGTYLNKNYGLVDKYLVEAYANAAKKYGLKNIIEILDYENQIDQVKDYCTHFQVGCRQTQNYQLLKKLGKCGKPVFLKRHPGIKLDEFLGAADQLLANGVTEIYLIERGSVSHVDHVRWDLSISMIPAIQKICKIPILVDASHGTGRRDLVGAMTLAGVAAGANGCLIETHYEPEKSISDSEQCLGRFDYMKLMTKIQNLRTIL